jgi:hypothetical protein
MSTNKPAIVFGVCILVVLTLLAQGTPVAAGPCGFPLPCDQSVTSPNTGMDVANVGDGVGINGYSQNNDAITARSSASGKSGVFSENTTNSGFGVFGVGWFGGYGIYGKSPDHGVGGEGKVGVYGLSDGTNGVFGQNTESGYGVAGTSTNGIAGYFYNTNTANARPSLKATTKGAGWTAQFSGTGPTSKGVYISTKPGNKGLQVAGGTKSAVVATSQGARTLYAEEASEVYFTDYGFGRLQDGRAIIAVDPLFAETVNLEKDYYVFLQPYGEAEVYVSETTPKSFEVRLRAKDTQGDANVKFAYRIVGKRRGFEQTRLEHAQWADSDPNLYPGKPTGKVAARK